MKKLNKKAKKKIIDIADTIFTIAINIIILLSIIYKEYGVGIILMLLLIYICMNQMELKCKVTLQIPNNDPIEVKKSFKKGKAKNEKNIEE